MFRKSRRQSSASSRPDADYALLRGKAGNVEGLWLSNPEHAQKPLLIDALLAKHDLGHLVGTRYRTVPNQFTDRGGVFVRFVGQGAADEPETPTAPGHSAGRELEVDGQRYPVHEDFDAFSRDAAAGKVALLKTSIVGLSMDDVSRLFTVLAATFGDNAPEVRAIFEAPFQCLTCFRSYSHQVIFLRDQMRDGSRIGLITSGDPERVRKILEMTACLDCGGQDAVWVYDPYPSPGQPD